MKFFAKVRKGSTTDRQWRRSPRVGGKLHGVHFHIVGNLKGGYFGSIGEIDGDQLVRLKLHPDVDIEMIGGVEALVPHPAAPVTVVIDTPPIQTQPAAIPMAPLLDLPPPTLDLPPVLDAEGKPRRGRPPKSRDELPPA